MTENNILLYLEEIIRKPNLQIISPYTDYANRPEGDTYSIAVIGDTIQGQLDNSRFNANYTAREFGGTAIIKVRFEFFGDNAFDNSSEARNKVELSIANHFLGPLSIKSQTKILNMSYMDKDTQFRKRYVFDMTFFALKKITINFEPIQQLIITKSLVLANN